MKPKTTKEWTYELLRMKQDPNSWYPYAFITAIRNEIAEMLDEEAEATERFVDYTPWAGPIGQQPWQDKRDEAAVKRGIAQKIRRMP